MTEKLFYWLFALSASSLLGLYHVAVVLPRAYGTASVATAAPWITCALFALGAWFARSRHHRGSARSALAHTLVSLLTSSAAYLLWFTFDHGAWLDATSMALAALTGFVAGAALCITFREYGRAFAELGLLSVALNPLRAAALAAACLGVLATFPHLGLLRSGALLGALLACATVFLPAVDQALDRPAGSRWARAIPAASLIGALVATGAASRFLPLYDFQIHAGDVLYVLDGLRGRHVVTRVQRAVLLFTNDVLTSTSTDSRRFAEAMVHPALAARSSRHSASADAAGASGLGVLVFANGTLAVEREVLRYPTVTRVTSVVPDGRLADLAGKSALLATLGGSVVSRVDSRAITADRRLTRIEAEAAPFVNALRERYDVILADFGDPTTYFEGKHYTRHVFTALRRVLGPGGVLALQLTSPLRTPRAHASVIATLRAAGFTVAPYRVPLPTLGEWGFALAYASASTPALPTASLVAPGTSFVTATNLHDFFVVPPTPAPPPSGTVNYLYDQPVVDLYQEDERRHWE